MPPNVLEAFAKPPGIGYHHVYVMVVVDVAVVLSLGDVMSMVAADLEVFETQMRYLHLSRELLMCTSSSFHFLVTFHLLPCGTCLYSICKFCNPIYHGIINHKHFSLQMYTICV